MPPPTASDRPRHQHKQAPGHARHQRLSASPQQHQSSSAASAASDSLCLRHVGVQCKKQNKHGSSCPVSVSSPSFRSTSGTSSTATLAVGPPPLFRLTALMGEPPSLGVSPSPPPSPVRRPTVCLAAAFLPSRPPASSPPPPLRRRRCSHAGGGRLPWTPPSPHACCGPPGHAPPLESVPVTPARCRRPFLSSSSTAGMCRRPLPSLCRRPVRSPPPSAVTSRRPGVRRASPPPRWPSATLLRATSPTAPCRLPIWWQPLRPWYL